MEQSKNSQIEQDTMNTPRTLMKSSSGKLGWLFVGALIGAAAMFILDPVTGSSRRFMVKDRAKKLKKGAQRYADTARDLSSRTQNIIGKARHAIDETLVH